MLKIRPSKKSCVRLFVLAVLFAAGYVPTTAQTPDVSSLPRLQFADLGYIGGFRLPQAAQNGDDFSFAGRAMAFNPARNSLFISSRIGNIAEVSIPTPANSSDVNAMPFASYLQGFRDMTEGHFTEIAADGAALSGLLVQGDRLYGTGSVYYDATNSQVLSHFSHSTNLSQSSFSGMSQVWETGHAGYVAGYLASVPSEWQSTLGGPAMTGQCCIPIVQRTSLGPAAFSFNPSSIAPQTVVPANPLLYYPYEHPTLGQWESSNSTYGAATAMGGAVIVAGTRTALFIGRNGTGPFCYGQGTSIQSLSGTMGPDGEKYCYDPVVGDKGQHAYPYRYQIWAYDLADFAAVKAGTKAAWDVVPYGVWPFDLPTPETSSIRIGGVSYDAQNQILYLLQLWADRDGYAYRPIVHALKMNVPASSSTPSRATAVTLTPNAAAPQTAGTTIGWTAQASGGNSQYEYKWFVYTNGAWSVARTWSSSPNFDWQPVAADADARVGVWVRSAGSTADALEVSAEYAFPITASPSTAPVGAVSLTANMAAPQSPLTTIRWTATTATTGAYSYKWFVFDGAAWAAMTGWTTTNVYDWTPSSGNANYRVGVWVKRSSNTADTYETSAEAPFAISDISASAKPVVILTSTLASPQATGTTIRWNAGPLGLGTAPLYKWFVNDGNSWQVVGSGWTTSNTFDWKPTNANANYRVGVWVKHNTNTADALEASAEKPFVITAPVAATPVSSVTLTANITPTTVGVPVTFTATPNGGKAPYEYKWYVYDTKWNVVVSWTTSNTFVWTPTAKNADYRIGVWVRSGGSTADQLEASAEYAAPIR